MTDGVPEVEHRAQPGLALVALHHAGLVADGTRHELLRHGLGGERSPRQLLHAAKHIAAGEEAVLGHFRGAAAELPVGQRLQRAQVRQHEARLVERADVVLAGAEVDGHLAADRGVHLGEQRRRHLHEPTPRWNVAATKPVRSPITPPPSATTVSLRRTPRS